MKAVIRIPMKEPYAYAEVEIELQPMNSNNPAILADAYKEYTDAFKVGDGVEEKEMNLVVDKMLKGETINGGMEIYVRMSEKQQYTIQAIKRGTARVNYALNKSQE